MAKWACALENLVRRYSFSGRIAVFGATSVMGRDFIDQARRRGYEVVSFGRQRVIDQNKEFEIFPYEDFNFTNNYAAIINFVGFGSPRRALLERESILSVTRVFDNWVLDYLRSHRETKYVFVSSGAIYELLDKFGDSVSALSHEKVLDPSSYYAFAKLEAETRHRELEDLNIFDIRVFNYVSERQTPQDGFFFTDLLGALIRKEKLVTDPDDVQRDFANSTNFADLVFNLLRHSGNAALDLYSSAGISKFDLLRELAISVGLEVEVRDQFEPLGPTGKKIKYLPRSRAAEGYGYRPQSSSLQNIIKVLESLDAKMISDSNLGQAENSQ